MPNYIANLNPNPVNGLGVEDLLLSQNLTSIQQTRGNLVVTVTPINAHNIPYGGSDKTIAEVLADTTSIEDRFNSLVGDSNISLNSILSKIDTETTNRLNTINKLNITIDKIKDAIVNDYIGRISVVDAAVANEVNKRELIERNITEDYRRLISELEKSLLSEKEELKELIYAVAENYKKADSKLEDDLLEVKCKLSKFVEAFGNAINKDDNSIDITDELVEAVDNVKGLLCH